MSILSNCVGSETVICQLQTLKTALIMLISKFGDYIIITATNNRTPVVWFLDTGYKILNKKIWRKKDDIDVVDTCKQPLDTT